jgi:hypothetical protein
MESPKDRAEAIFKKKTEPASGADAARNEQEQKASAVRERTAQLKSLRLAKETAEKARLRKQP